MLRLCFCGASLLCWNKTWFCILDVTNSTLGRIFLVLIVEGESHPMACMIRRSGEEEL